jgi:hypothetical protein
MSNSNAMAIGEDYGYEEDQYERYATDMTNDNYYKSQGSDFIKKIKCNNINTNINGDDNTINLGSGHGVGPEFIQDDASANAYGYGDRNNGNSDVHCISNNKIEGAAGPQGPSGITVIDSSNFYSREGISDTTTDTPDDATSTAECEEEDTAISGSFDVSPELDTGIDNYEIRDFGPVGIVPSNEWQTHIFGVQDVTVTTGVLCFDNPPLNTLASASAVSAFQQQSEDSPIISQGIADSPKLTALEKQPEDSSQLTATEKITKLKQQWMELTS